MQVGRPVRSAALALAFLAFAVSAQQPAAPSRYTTASYWKVLPGKAAALREYYTNGDGAKVIRATMKANPKMLSWSLRQALFAGNPAPESNYFTLILWDGAPSLLDPAKRDEVYKAATGLTYAQQQEKLAGMREIVGSTLNHVHDLAGTLDQGDFVVAQRYKTAEGRTGDLSTLMHDFRLPMVTENMKRGQLKFWGYSHLALAGGNSQPWDCTVTRGFKNLEGALGAGAPGNNPNAQAQQFATLFPKKSFTAYQSEFREWATLVRTEVSQVLVLIRP